MGARSGGGAGDGAAFDPWYFQRWAYAQRVGSATRKLILGSLATRAESGTGYCFAMQDELAEHAECSTRTVRDHLAALEAAGLIARRRRFSKSGRRLADGFLLLAPGVDSWPDGDPVDQQQIVPPADPAAGSPASSPPEAQASGQERPKGTATPDEGGSAGAREADGDDVDDPRNRMPDDFPEHLVPHARAVFRVLRSVAEDHSSAKRLWPREVGLAIMATPRRPLVATAHELAGWAVDPPRPIKDVARTYRTFLAKTRDLASPEPLADDGTVVDARPGRPDNVRDLHGRRLSNAEQVEQNLRAARAAAEWSPPSTGSDTVGSA